MAKILFAIVALCLCQVAFGRVARDAPAAPADDFFTQAQNAITTLFASFDSTKIQDTARLFVDNMQNVTSTLTKLAKENSGPIEQGIKDLQAKLDETVKEFKTKIEDPEFTKQTAEYQETFRQSLKGVLDDAEKFRIQIVSQGAEVGGKLETALSDVVDQVKKSIDTKA